ncbi:MAG TPA: peptide-methionine (S)-S-oxide reductase MsrA [Acidimicrobiales bacterium]|nr:peptide-methionine (S)-S-oxide reductase MsrA [Acidimicrobiales bacterium]
MSFKTNMVTPEEAIKGRAASIVVSRPHLTLGTSLLEPTPAGTETAYLAMGCFWGAERKFYQLEGVVSTAAGYQGGYTENPTYEEVCTGRTGHAEAVKVVFDPSRIRYADVLQSFFENHDPTQGNRQGNDIGTQYRSAIFYRNDDQAQIAREVAALFAVQLADAGFGPLTTEIAAAGPFYLAEEYHQQYLEANPNGYCGLGGTGVSCPVGLLAD